MALGFFTIDQEENIGSIGPSVLKYAKQHKGIVQWHGEGSFKINDLIILLRNQELKIYRYQNQDLIPIVKNFDEIPHQDGIILDIIYSGDPIKIYVENELLHIFIHEQGYAFQMNEKNMLIVADDEGIIFFSHKDISEKEIDNILSGGNFDAYIEDNLNIKVQDIFDQSILEGMREAEEKEVSYVNRDGKIIALRKFNRFYFSEHFTTYSIGSEADYLEDVKENTEIFNCLYFNRDIRINHDELSCEARLRGYEKEVETLNNKISKVCRKNVTIVLTGESGTGKTRLARLIHKNSRRSNGPFVNVNCAAISYNLIESDLFGYEEGAFTGARRGGKIGYFELAKGGTLFLDEISELPLKLQGKLLEVLQEGTFYRVGGIKKISADVRLIVATNKNLEKMVKENKFREDLYYRINVFPIHLPPLRDRLNDLYSIIDDTLPPICERLEIDPLMLTNEALTKMKKYNWPGNIRELENVLEKAAVMADEHFIREEDIVLENTVAGFTQIYTLKERMQEYEREIIFQAYEKFNGDRGQMQAYLGISKTNLFEKIHKYHIE